MGVFREHYIGGIVSYSAFFGISMGTTFVGHWLFQKPIDWNSTVSIKPWWHIVACFVIAILFTHAACPSIRVNAIGYVSEIEFKIAASGYLPPHRL